MDSAYLKIADVHVGIHFKLEKPEFSNILNEFIVPGVCQEKARINLTYLAGEGDRISLPALSGGNAGTHAVETGEGLVFQRIFGLMLAKDDGANCFVDHFQKRKILQSSALKVPRGCCLLCGIGLLIEGAR